MVSAIKISDSQQRIAPTIYDYSFWDILDMDATFSTSMRKMKETHNDLLPTNKGRVRSPEYTTAKLLVHLLGHEMEHARKARPDLYKLYLSNQVDCLPVHTNREQLRTLMDEEYSVRSYSNFIDRLMDAGIILHKRNTSRVVKRTVDENGKVHKVITVTAAGRGNFILYINKKALTFHAAFAKNESTDNQRVTKGQEQNLQQSHDILKETLKIIKNKRGDVENGSALPAKSEKTAAKASENIGIRNEGNCNAETTNSGAMTPSAEIYVEKLSRDNLIAKKLPKNDKDYFATLLFSQMKKQVYPKYTEETMTRIEPHAKNLLRLHLQRLNYPIEESFQRVSRAIYLAARYLETHPKAYVYAPMTWLRIDDEYQSGTLKTIVDEWIPKEEKRLLVYDNHLSEMVKWQYAVRFTDKVFLEVVMQLKKSFSLGLKACKTGFGRLDTQFEKYELSESVRKQLKKRYADRMSAVITEMERLGEQGNDTTWFTFQRYRKIVNKRR